jgi:hypothetical protein
MRGSNKFALLAGAIFLGLAAVATVLVLVFSQKPGGGTAGTGSAKVDSLARPTSFSATVTMVVTVGTYGSCEGGGYSDIRGGGQVEIVNQKNEVIALGTLTKVSGGYCSFTASVANIPTGEKMYGAKMGNANRGVIWKSEDEARQGWQLTLG